MHSKLAPSIETEAMYGDCKLALPDGSAVLPFQKEFTEDLCYLRHHLPDDLAQSVRSIMPIVKQLMSLSQHTPDAYDRIGEVSHI